MVGLPIIGVMVGLSLVRGRVMVGSSLAGGRVMVGLSPAGAGSW